MGIFMMWYCPCQPVSVEKAAAYYENKYHQRPNLCQAPPNITVEVPADIQLVRNPHVLPCLIWLGVEESQQNAN